MLLHGYGLLGLFRLPYRQGSLASPVLRFGIMASLFGWAIFIVGMGKRHMIVHLMQRAMDSGTSPEMAAEFETLAVATYADMAGIIARVPDDFSIRVLAGWTCPGGPISAV